MTEIIIASSLIIFLFSILGCFVLWRSYGALSDGIAHASILAAVIAHIVQLHINAAAMINAIFFTIIILLFKRNQNHNDNSFNIGAASSSMVALSLILIQIFDININITGLLFGDMLAVQRDDLYMIYVLLIVNLAFLFYSYRKLIMITLSKEIAYSRFAYSWLYDYLFLCILSISIILVVKMVGALMVTSIIILPPLIARLVARNPYMMLIYSMIAGQIINLSSMQLSFYFDLPFGATIILVALTLYCFVGCIVKIFSIQKRA